MIAKCPSFKYYDNLLYNNSPISIAEKDSSELFCTQSIMLLFIYSKFTKLLKYSYPLYQYLMVIKKSSKSSITCSLVILDSGILLLVQSTLCFSLNNLFESFDIFKIYILSNTYTSSLLHPISSLMFEMFSTCFSILEISYHSPTYSTKYLIYY